MVNGRRSTDPAWTQPGGWPAALLRGKLVGVESPGESGAGRRGEWT